MYLGGIFLSKKIKRYNKDTKLKAVKRYLNDGLSYQAVADEMGIKSKTQVDRWVKKFKKLGNTAFDTEKRGRVKGFSPKSKKSKGEFSSLEEEIKYLKMEVEYLKKLNEIIGR